MTRLLFKPVSPPGSEIIRNKSPLLKLVSPPGVEPGIRT